MYYLIYSSTASDDMNESVLKEILSEAERCNKLQNITGLLVYFDGSFIQMLEGKEEDVIETFERIKGDPRHVQIIKLFSGDVDKRHFLSWKMSLEVLDKAAFSNIEAYESLDEGDQFLQHLDDEHIGLKMLRYFYEMKRK
jgi:hypothetical protein